MKFNSKVGAYRAANVYFHPENLLRRPMIGGLSLNVLTDTHTHSVQFIRLFEHHETAPI